MNTEMNRRDVLKLLAMLGFTPGMGQNRIAEASESWASHETGGATVMPSRPEEYQFVIYTVYGQGDQMVRRSGRWSVRPQADGSLACEAFMHQHEAGVRRDEDQRWIVTVPKEGADAMCRLLECDVNERVFTARAVRRIEPGASASPRPLGMASFGHRWSEWEIVDDRSIIHAEHAPYNAIIAPKTIYRMNREPDDSRIHERYLAVIEPLTDEEEDIRRRTVWRNGEWIVEEK
jgi:hypothetical protein